MLASLQGGPEEVGGVAPPAPGSSGCRVLPRGSSSPPLLPFPRGFNRETCQQPLRRQTPARVRSGVLCGRPGSCSARSRFSPRASDAERASGHADGAGDGAGRTLLPDAGGAGRGRPSCAAAARVARARGALSRCALWPGVDASRRPQRGSRTGCWERARAAVGSGAGVQGRGLGRGRHWIPRSRRWLACGRGAASRSAAGTQG